MREASQSASLQDIDRDRNMALMAQDIVLQRWPVLKWHYVTGTVHVTALRVPPWCELQAQRRVAAAVPPRVYAGM